MAVWTELVSQLPILVYAPYVVLATVAVFCWYYYQGTRKKDWSQYGVKSLLLPKLYFLTGDFRERISNLLNEHGDTIGITAGPRLALVTCNLDLLKNVMIKDFSNFQDRSGTFLTSTPLGKSLFFATGNSWRRHRQIVSSVFTTGKLKYISKHVEKSARDLAGYLDKFARSGEVVQIKEVCGQFTCEIIARTAFGFSVECIGQQEEFYLHARNILQFSRRTIGQLLRMIPLVPQICVNILKLQLFDRINLTSYRYFDAVLKSTMANRRASYKSVSKKLYPDFLDLLLKANEAASEGKLYSHEEDLAEIHASESVRPVQALTDEEILGHSMLIIFAGLETTASTLQMCLYELALNPDVQETVYNECQEVVKSEAASIEELNRLSYTEQVINETLRLYPPLPSINRLAKESISYNGITIPKGATVMIPLFHILKDPSIYPDPDKFDPNRFSSEEKEKRNPLSFIPFGQGPRQCLGMRLAYLELKQGLVHILRKLRVVLNEDTIPKKGEGKVKTVALEVLTTEKLISLAFELRTPKTP